MEFSLPANRECNVGRLYASLSPAPRSARSALPLEVSLKAEPGSPFVACTYLSERSRSKVASLIAAKRGQVVLADVAEQRDLVVG
jgi:hypothetical protein